MLRLVLLIVFIFLNTQIVSAQNATILTSIIVDDNNLSGGGFQSDVTITDDGLTVYSAADVSGIFKSTDGGLSYVTINEGLQSPKIASIAITPDNKRILYAGSGDKGNNGGLFRSENGGETWIITAAGDSAFFAGNHSFKDDPVPDSHPRSNGDLIAVAVGQDTATYTDDVVIVGTYKHGVKVFTEGGDKEAVFIDPIFEDAAAFVRSIAYNPAIPNMAFAAIQFQDSLQNGIYKIDFSNTDSISTALVYQTLRPEGLAVLNSGHVYGAIGAAGIVKYNGNSWYLVNNNLDNSLPRQWTAVTGYVKNGTTDIVYASVNNRIGEIAGPNFSSVWRSKNGGQLWEPLVDAIDNVSHQIYGQSYDWWYSTKAFPNASLGKGNNVVSSIDVAKGTFENFVTDDIIYVSGRGGIWKSEDGGGNWNPAVYNMQATANNDVAINPNNPTQIAIANTDYVVLETSDRFRNSSLSRDKPANSSSKGYDVIFDATSDDVIVGTGSRDNNEGGEVFIKPAEDLGNLNVPWLNTKLIDETSNQGRVRAVSYGYHDGNSALTTVSILAAVEEDGVYRYHNGVWTKSTGISFSNKTNRSRFIWPDNCHSGVVYLLDLSTGLLRSNDGGVNWTNIWPCMTFHNNDFFNTGYITADDNDPTTLYLSMQSKNTSCIGKKFKVYKMEGADEAIFGDPDTSDNITDITFHSNNSQIKRPGPLGIGPDGKLWLTQQQDSKNNIDAELFVMEDPQNDLSFIDVTSEDYRNIAIQPSGIDVSSDGYVYIAQSGTGLVKIKYTDTANIQLSDACIEIYPNSTNSVFTIMGTLSQYTIEIIDANGDVYSVLDNTGDSVCIDVSDLPLGTFLVRVSNPVTAQLQVEKILKF